VNVVVGDRYCLPVDLNELHFCAIRCQRVGDSRARQADIVLDRHTRRRFLGRHHSIAVCLDLVHDLAQIRYRKPDVIERAAFGGTAWHSRVQEDEDIGKLDDVERPSLDRRPAERIDPEFLVLIDAGRVEMMMPVDNRTVLGDQDLRQRLGRWDRDRCCEEREREKSFHGASITRFAPRDKRGCSPFRGDDVSQV
jgi:hypothetical protein